jgi:hypothetical protein
MSGGTKKSPYIIVEEFAYFTEVLPHAGPTVRTILLHLSKQMNIFHATSTTKRYIFSKHNCSRFWLDNLHPVLQSRECRSPVE